MATVNN